MFYTPLSINYTQNCSTHSVGHCAVSVAHLFSHAANNIAQVLPRHVLQKVQVLSKVDSEMRSRFSTERLYTRPMPTRRGDFLTSYEFVFRRWWRNSYIATRCNGSCIRLFTQILWFAYVFAAILFSLMKASKTKIVCEDYNGGDSHYSDYSDLDQSYSGAYY